MPEVVAVGAVDAVDEASDEGRRTLDALRQSHADMTVLVADAPSSIAALVERVSNEGRAHVLVVSRPVQLPRHALGRALAMIEGDRRIASVSFFGDEPGFLNLSRPGDLEADDVSRALRLTGPELEPTPIPYAAGPAVLLGHHALSVIGPLRGFQGPDAVGRALADLSHRGRQRGFFSLLDPSTFCLSLSENPGRAASESRVEPEATLVAEYEAAGSPLHIVRGTARAKVCGLRVLIDGARLGPLEMGTQVATVALVRALARRGDVARVCIALAGDLPSYALALRDDPKIDARVCPDRDFSAFGRVDVAHRPFQPDSPSDMDAFRAVAERTAITVLDLIAYHAVSYQLAPEHWRTYRDWLRQSVVDADAVVAPTADVRHQLLLERLPVDPDRLVVAELGTDHLSADAPEARPERLPADTGDFVVVLGADYTHKNRDLAVRAHGELCAAGFDLALVMAGIRVHGSSRELEGDATQGGQGVIDLPGVSSEERNWLLRHARLVLYPTSAEGFGLVPFEAARLGTPTVFVPFGPLEELGGDVPVLAEDWAPSSLAAAAARLLRDPDVARAQVAATLRAGDRYTWDATASKLVAVYRDMLARPPAARRPPLGHEDGAGATDELERLRAENEDLRRSRERVEQSVAYKLAAGALHAGRAVRDGVAGRLRRPLFRTTLNR